MLKYIGESIATVPLEAHRKPVYQIDTFSFLIYHLPEPLLRSLSGSNLHIENLPFNSDFKMSMKCVSLAFNLVRCWWNWGY